MNKHILVISQYFYPENFRINDMCNEWIKRGYKVTVLTGIPNYPKGKFFKGYGLFKKRKEVWNGIKIIRLPIISRGKSSIRLMINYLSFVISGWFWKVFTRTKADFVFIFEVSPMTQALPGVWFAKRRKIPCYLYVQDLWPENVQIVGGVSSKRVLKSIGKMVDYIYKRSTKVLVTSNSFKTSICSRGVAEDKVLYWPQYAEDFYKPLKLNLNEYNISKLNVMFTGNIGEAQGLDILPILAEKLQADGFNDRVVFTLIGDGRSKDKLKETIKENNIEKMFIFEGQKPSTDIPNYLSSADIAFLSFSDNELFKMTIPAKLQSYMACGKPIFAVASGETKSIIDECKCGLVSEPGDIDAAYVNLLKFMKMNQSQLDEYSYNSIEYAKNYFNKKTLMDYFDKLISEE